MYMNTVIKEVCKYNHSLCDLRCKLCQHGSWDDAIIHPSVRMDNCRCYITAKRICYFDNCIPHQSYNC